MPQPTIVSVDHLDGDLIVIELSDNTSIHLTVEQLLALDLPRIASAEGPKPTRTPLD